MNLTLDYLSLGILFTVLLVLIYGLIIIHDIPYEMAKKRNHPHAEAIHIAGLVSLFFLHVLWPFLWIWTSMYDNKEAKWLGATDQLNELKYNVLLKRIEKIEQEVS
ncbi:hypothetical protein CWN94_10740 [Vibrio splendidus]|uniref:DUF3302 domain-containing protein n=1 Tax=Vibrio splendidus TaxID=29497 RepID=UPI000D336CAA|nr:DUF3302 domain-containing protein [Vibrio splendidus]PTO54279.1 hypothetical protein CWN94_10740 [Vibrio splendidus]PTQ01394.1 hypothetical protein CWO34_00435 [Vibrio splendidus]